MDRIYQSDTRTLDLRVGVFSSKIRSLLGFAYASAYTRIRNAFYVDPDIHPASNLLDFFKISAETAQSVLLKFFHRLLKLPRLFVTYKKVYYEMHTVILL